jgi:CBS domain-containing protein
MTTVGNVLQSKGREIWSIAPEALVFDALKVLAEKNVGALLVMDGRELVGVFSERDYARKIALRGESSHTAIVKNVMSTDVIYVEPGQSIEQCMALMTARHIRHLPVVEGTEVVGVISIGDTVKALISERENMIKQLENYITGTR